ncbi:MAG: choice-of-anchor Q domain-containing protein [Pyrinomonadaceae bacterium]
MRLLRPAIILFILILTACPILSYSATFVVTKPADTNDGICDTDCSLREAVAAANSANTNDDVRFSPLFSAPTTIGLALGEIVIANNGTLSIVGFDVHFTTISGNNQSRIFFASPNANLSLSNLSLKRGNAVGPQFSGNGGAIALYLTRLTVSNCAFFENSASLNGGAIHDFYISTVTVSNSQFYNNTAANGGAIFVHASAVSVSDVSFTKNVTSGAGGALYLYSGAGMVSLSVQNSTFTGNSATAGGGLYSNFGANITNSRFHQNVARAGDGGAVNVQSGTFDLIHSQITSNTATFGGGGINRYGGGTVRDCVIRGNSTSGVGGGIAIYFALLNIERSVIANNSAETGGGIWGGSIISGSSIEGNTASDVGGGIFGGGIISNSTISGNTAGGDGGGIRGGGTFTNVTLVNNKATSGAGIFTAGAPLSARNSIFANNTTYIATQEDIFGTLNSQGYNLIKSTLAASLTGDTTTNIMGVDPFLFPLTRGDTPNFHALSPNSPAVDKGSSSGSTTDQRGLVRPFDFTSIANAVGGDGADIGAIERQTTDNFGYEADLGPRPTGDGAILSNDVFLLRQFVLGNLSLDNATNEFQRADCAPRATLGDGSLDSADVVQARRYALGLDPISTIGGPTSQGGSFAEAVFGRTNDDGFLAATQFQITSRTALRGERVSLPVELITAGKVSAVSFTIEFDPAALLDPHITAPNGANVALNAKNAGKGQIGVLVDSDGSLKNRLDRQIVMLEFTVAPKAPPGNSLVLFTGTAVPLSVAGVKAENLNARWTDGYVLIQE